MYSTNVLTPQYVTPLFTFSSSLTRLYFVDSDNNIPLTPTLKSVVLTAISTRLPSIQKLRLSRTWVLSRDELSRLIRACPNLVELMMCMQYEDHEILRWLTPFLLSLTAVIMMSPETHADGRGERELEEKKDEVEAHLAVDGFMGIQYLGIFGLIVKVGREIRWDGNDAKMDMESRVDELGRVARRVIQTIEMEQARSVLGVLGCEKGVDV